MCTTPDTYQQAHSKLHWKHSWVEKWCPLRQKNIPCFRNQLLVFCKLQFMLLCYCFWILSFLYNDWSISTLRIFFVFVLHIHSLLDQISHKISTWQKQWHHWMDHEMKFSIHKSQAKAIGRFKLFVLVPFNTILFWKTYFRENLSHSSGTSPYFNLISLC